jgi:6-pyruvoyltetrahydropterin/6-carboxytetrahydropterin synthase
MFSVKIEADFSSAHNLRGYQGKCEELHGHNWKVELVASRDKLDKAGMVLDFKYIKAELKK